MSRSQLLRVAAVLALACVSPALQGGVGFRQNFEERLLAAHNRERDAIGAPPLQWDPALARSARDWAAYLARTGKFEHSPDSPWWDAPNVIVTPHASGHTLRFFDELVVENVRRYLAGEPLLNPVDPERGY